MCKQIFVSQFASSMEEFIDFRCGLGYKRITYETDLLRLDKFIAEHFPNENSITKDLAMTWIETLPTSTNARIVRLFAQYLVSIGTDSFILPANFVVPKNKAVPYILNDEELNRLFRSIDKLSSRQKICRIENAFPVMFRLIYTCGLRPSEGITLKREKISESTGKILITATKKNRERTVIMSDDMNAYMERYLSSWEISHEDNPYLFPYGNGCVTYHQARDFFRACWRDANPDVETCALPKLCIYDLRHRFATENIMRWTEQKANIPALMPYLKTYMGHANITGTEYYLHLMPERISAYQEAVWNDLTKLIPEV